MSKLPYIQPNKDKHYNLGIILILLNSLSRTKRGKLNITIERLQIFYFLVTRPVLMNQVLSLSGKNVKKLEEVDVYSVSTISQNVDELFDKNKIRALLKELISYGYIDVNLTEKDGFVFELSNIGKSKVKDLKSGYFLKIISFSESLKLLLSESTSKLNSYINVYLTQR
ncbi:ABC-three component system middle component 4 [Vibrio parahaemolyticus]|uniref:ABC-three component system middle component 4 n=1 Tax=Vibrio parahaemolyticus TaxID=670 RepID=UPI00081BCDD1|nr:ABC-three component system middle component 4 [Vibrio parahaemolyticus]EJE4206113.1 hypothetical protein [Vibrio parahaemolyticus]MDF4266470.1 hypothetical protein [Vibrio parahaemolyticus]MDF4272026.1 hypothetical protein [Vibrio parahaemolyticus]MDF4296584.1 hypothetical protein [Vibrio parahaemolyticus]WHT04947.1 hypothetical protein O2T11_23680 [Vibrio parahaemolyticus]